MMSNSNISRLLASSTMSLLLTILPVSSQAADDVPISLMGTKSLPVLPYSDENGAAKTVSADNHKLTAVHFWATWCVPCVAELIEVDKTQALYADKGFHVIALSEDGTANLKKVQEFFVKNQIRALKPNIDSDMKSLQAVKLRGMPTTIFLDKDGNAIAQAEGALDWNAPATTQFIESHLK